MEKPPITTVDIDNFKIWYETEDPSFTSINLRSNIPRSWMEYKTILSGKNADSIIKPINRYVERLYPPPKLVSIENNIIRLRQGNHAEFFLLEQEDGTFYHKDRPWQRQYYNTDQSKYTVPEDCFDGTFKFYVPWFVDEDVVVYFEPCKDSPFHVYPSMAHYHKVLKSTLFVEPHMVPFHFKKVGAHMVKENFGKISRQTPMFDMVFHASDIIVARVKEFYEQEK